MSWKKYREIFNKGKADESLFILGLDLGDSTSALAFYDHLRQSPEIIDMSGGYGKSSSPTVMQYIPDSGEWVYGEYAVLNKGQGEYYNVENLLERLGRMEYVEVDGRPFSVPKLLGMYIREFVGNLYNINPRAEIAGMNITVPGYISEMAISELQNALKIAGNNLDKKNIRFISNTECLLRYYFHFNQPKAGNVLLLDFGNREIRAGIYAIDPRADSIEVTAQSSLFDGTLGVQAINEAVDDMLTRHYCEQKGVAADTLSNTEHEQLSAFSYQHRDLLFQRRKDAKPVKLYYNFAYPPFSVTVTIAEMEQLLEPYSAALKRFLRDVARKTLDAAHCRVDEIICTGGGFEMQWAKRAVADVFPAAGVQSFKDAKGVAAQGAAICAAVDLGAYQGMSLPININDPHKLSYDVGVMIRRNNRDSFLPMLEKGTFWWQRRRPLHFILTDGTDSGPKLTLYRRDGDGGLSEFGELPLEGLPERPPATTTLSVELSCPAYNKICVNICDLGFGEIFPAAEFRRKFQFEL